MVVDFQTRLAERIKLSSFCAKVELRLLQGVSTMLSTIQWTVEDYQQIVKTGILDDRPVQLLAGDIVTMAPEAEPHAFFIGTGSNRIGRSRNLQDGNIYLSPSLS